MPIKYVRSAFFIFLIWWKKKSSLHLHTVEWLLFIIWDFVVYNCTCILQFDLAMETIYALPQFLILMHAYRRMADKKRGIEKNTKNQPLYLIINECFFFVILRFDLPSSFTHSVWKSLDFYSLGKFRRSTCRIEDSKRKMHRIDRETALQSKSIKWLCDHCIQSRIEDKVS